MNRALQTLFLTACMIVHGLPALAGSADCGLIKDETMRRTCYARASRKESDCFLIQDRDAERFCRSLSKR